MIYIVVSTEIDGAQHGVALQVPDGWMEDPAKAEQLCYSAMTMFRNHCKATGLRLLPGHDVTMTLEDH